MNDENSIGPVVNAGEISFTSGLRLLETKVLFQTWENDECRHQIQFKAYSVEPPAGFATVNLAGVPRVLPRRACHTFEWRLDEAFGDGWDAEFDFLRSQEAYHPLDLIQHLPRDVQREAKITITAWLSNEYLALNPEMEI